MRDFFFDKVTQIKSVLSGIADAISGAFKGAFNGIARAWNNSVGKLRFEIPSWVPGGLGGKGWDVPDMPILDSGGIVTRPMIAALSMNSRPEVVMPLDDLDHMLSGKGGGVTIYVSGQDMPDATAQAIAAAQRLQLRAA